VAAVAAAAAACTFGYILAGSSASDAQIESIANPQYSVLVAARPRIYRLHSLFSAMECDLLIKLAQERIRPSMLGAAAAAATSFIAESDLVYRNSSSMSFALPSDAADAELQRLRHILSDAARMPDSLAEPLQVSRYRDGEAFGLHTDADPQALDALFTSAEVTISTESVSIWPATVHTVGSFFRVDRAACCERRPSSSF